MHVFIFHTQFAVENVVVVEEEEETVKKTGLALSASALLQAVIFGTNEEISAAHTKFPALRFTRGSLQVRAQL